MGATRHRHRFEMVRQDKFPKMGKLTPTEVAAAKGWWQLGDGDRGRCSECENKMEAQRATK